MIVQVKYCGGCNPRYDRVAFLDRLKKTFPEIDFVYKTEPGAEVSTGLVICGCDTACAETAGCIGNCGRIVVWKESAFDTVCGSLEEILSNQKEERKGQ